MFEDNTTRLAGCRAARDFLANSAALVTNVAEFLITSLTQRHAIPTPSKTRIADKNQRP
ncbi:MAG TPA: hypothetical protein PLN33_01255 [Hyphomonadaceae bacterium]|nr:hypothetical protein [Hyphomonadaceae bacterium]